MAYVQRDGSGNIIGAFANPQAFAQEIVADSDPSIAAFAALTAAQPQCQLWQLEAALTTGQWAAVLAAIAAQNNPVLSAFAMHGNNVIPANSTTLLALGAAIGLNAAQVSAIVAAAAAIKIP